jgi:hypothetical protein
MENHFTNQYEEQFGADLVNEAEAYLGIVGAEAFFAIRAQIDAIIAEEVDLSSMPDQEDWSLAGFTRRSRDLAAVAASQGSPAGPIAVSLSRSMSEILGDAVIRAQASEADREDDQVKAKEVAEKSRCLSLLRSSIYVVEEKILSGEEKITSAAPAAGEAEFIEVNEDGSKAKSGGRKTKKSSKAKGRSNSVKPKPIVTSTGISIRIE